jgi:uncharacterized membrane protein
VTVGEEPPAGYYKDKDGVTRPRTPKKDPGAVTGVAVFLVAAAVAGSVGVGGAVAAGEAVESVVGQGIQARVTSSRNAARRGQYSEAWRWMGLRAISREIRRKPQCAVHSYSQVQQFFLHTPC